MSSIASVSAAASALAARGVAYSGQIESAAANNGLDPRLLAAVAAQETGGPGSNSGRNIVGDGGHGRGLFQIDDRYHDFARSASAMNPQANADCAAGMIRGLLGRYGGDVHKALSAYNSGDPNASGTMTRWQDGSQLGYADSVLRHYSDLGGSASSDSSTLETLSAESSGEQANVNALSSFALLQPPAPTEQPSYSYRRLAGLDDNGHSKQSNGLGSIVDPEDDGAADDDATPL